MSGYIELNRTGFAPFDSALSMIEEAGDAYHHTSRWIEDGWNGEKPYLDQINEEISIAADSYMTLYEELQAGRLQWMVRETVAEKKVADLTLKLKLAQEALESCPAVYHAAIGGKPCTCGMCEFLRKKDDALSAIKEQETEIERLSASYKTLDEAWCKDQVEKTKLHRQLAAEQLRNERLAELANECRLTLLSQVHELADHIERANYCISDQDMLKQMNGQAAFAMKVSDKWNHNGNPFKALSEPHDTAALEAYVQERIKEAMKCSSS